MQIGIANIENFPLIFQPNAQMVDLPIFLTTIYMAYSGILNNKLSPKETDMLIINSDISHIVILIENDELNISSHTDNSHLLESIFQRIKCILPEADMKNVEIDFYPGKEDCLLFVNLGSSQPISYIFSSFENLLSALDYCDDLPSKLFYCNENYILIIRSRSENSLSSHFYEFCDETYDDENAELYLSEHGKMLIPSHAITYLKNTFCLR